MKNTPCVGVLTLVLSLFLANVAAAQNITLVPIGSMWRYLDDGTDPGTAWRLSGFVDSAWPVGPAKLGFGDGDEATVISRTSPAGATNLAFYFRHAFEVANPVSATNLLVRMRRDDGAVVYLNGIEIFRSNLPPGPITATTLALMATGDDGVSYFANPVSPALLRPGGNILAVEVHQSAASSSDVTFDLELVANVAFLPPTISIATPTNGTSVGSVNLVISAAAADPDGSIAIVEFFNGTTPIGFDTAGPYSVTWSNITLGSYTIRAVATDTTGINSTSAPVTFHVAPRLVASGSPWRYLDTGVEPGATWFQPAFVDDSWPIGDAQLGFGDGDEATVLSRTNNAGGTNITYYFRHAFDKADLAGITNLVVRVVRDDGCLVYLNGVEVFRDNLPAGGINSSTLALEAVDDPRYRAARIPPSLLVPGRNVLAVSVHQAAVTSSDISFDLELRPNVLPASPSILIAAPTNNSQFLDPASIAVTTISEDFDDRIVSVAFSVNGSATGLDTTEPYTTTITNLPPGSYSLVATATDELGHVTTSPPVLFRVVQPPVVASLIATGSVWRYFDGGVDLGRNWRETWFDDSAWKSGRGKLGSNDNPVTTIDIGPATGRYLTTYFRHHFQADGARTITNLGFRVLRDDGCVVYLNGQELFRMNMASGPMSFTNRALTAVGGTNENHYFPYSMEPPPGLLVDGENVLAVELHQNDTTSTDAGFDLGLMKTTPPGAVALSIQVVNAMLRIEWPGNRHVLQSAPAVDGPFSDVTPAVTAAPYLAPVPVTDRYYRLRTQ
jgi:hypothetical protein